MILSSLCLWHCALWLSNTSCIKSVWTKCIGVSPKNVINWLYYIQPRTPVFFMFSLKWNPLQQFWLLMESMGIARNLSRGKLWNSRPKAESGEEAVGKQARGSGRELPSGVRAEPRHIESPENTSSGHKCRLVLFFSIRFGGTLGCHSWNP